MIIQNNLAFKVKDLKVAYKNKIVLSEIQMDIKKNHVTAIIGPSGCGKSTLLRVLNRTLELVPEAKILEGYVYFKDENIYEKNIIPQIIRKKIGMVMQKPIPFPLSIKDNILFGVKFHKNFNGKSKDEIVENCLKTVGLWNEVKDRLNENASSLSMGQLQRLCIARALANDPEALLMDEPCSALDPKSTSKIEELILNLKNYLSIIIVTHNIAQAKRISDYCVFITEGKIIQQGKTFDIFENPINGIVRDFITGKVG